jgi:hypothetical protein
VTLDPIALANLTALVAQRLGVSPLDENLKRDVKATASLLLADPTHARALGGWDWVKGAGH